MDWSPHLLEESEANVTGNGGSPVLYLGGKCWPSSAFVRSIHIELHLHATPLDRLLRFHCLLVYGNISGRDRLPHEPAGQVPYRPLDAGT